MNRIAFVVPWFHTGPGEDIRKDVFRLAARLARRGHQVDVLTTSPEARPGGSGEGVTDEQGFRVRRFSARARDEAAFDAVRAALKETRKQVGASRVPAGMARALVGQGIHSPELLDHLEREHNRYRAIVFTPYWSTLTIEGMQRGRERVFLQPALQDETPAYLPSVEIVFRNAKRILFVSDEEAQLAARIFGPQVARKGSIVGRGPDVVDTPDAVGAEAAVPNAAPGVLRERGERGRECAQEQKDWEKLIDRYEEALRLRQPESQRPPPRPALRAIHQLLPSIDYGDAISNQAVFTREVLHELGYESEIFVLDIGAPMRDFARRFNPESISPDDGLLYHHAIGTALTEHAIRHPGPKALQYHNITPGQFFERWDPKFAAILEMGRKDLPRLAAAFPVSAGDSTYNADELRDAGFKDPMVVPIFVDPMRWARPVDPEWLKTLQDGRTNLLFVGRVAPNKCQHHLVQAFGEYLRHDPGARLILAGVWPEGHPYARFVRDEAQRLGIGAQMLLASRITDAQLLACYRTAHLFWSMSEHEGFCVPVVEAMWFDVPVLAYESSAIPETLGQAGILFTEKRFPELGALAHMLVEDRALRATVIAAQRRRRSAFLPEAILPALRELLARLGDEAKSRRDGQRPATDETSLQYPSMMRGQR